MNIANQDNEPRYKLVFVVLAGGQGKRAGGQNKGLILWQGQPLIQYTLDWIAEEAKSLNGLFEVVLVTNDRFDDYLSLITDLDYCFEIKLVPDRYPDFKGPLAGIDAAFAHSIAQWLQCVPCDSTHLPRGLSQRLATAHSHNLIITPRDAHRDQPLFSQIHKSLWPSLMTSIEQDKLAVYRWMLEHQPTLVDVSDLISDFENFNTLTQLNEKSL